MCLEFGVRCECVEWDVRCEGVELDVRCECVEWGVRCEGVLRVGCCDQMCCVMDHSPLHPGLC